MALLTLHAGRRTAALVAGGLAAALLLTAAPAAAAANVARVAQFGTPADDHAHAVAATSTGVYAGGWTDGTLPTQSSSGARDAFLRKWSSAGQVTWNRQFGTAGDDAVVDTDATPSGIYVVGYTDGAIAGSSRGGRDAFLRKYNAFGRHLWTRQMGTAGSDSATAVAAYATSSSEAVYVAGNAAAPLGETPQGQPSGFVRKYSAEGKHLWTLQLGAAGEVTDVDATPPRLHVVGSTATGDAFVHTYNGKDADELWAEQFGTAAGDQARSVAANGSRVFVGGSTGGAWPDTVSAGGRDGFVRAYDMAGGVVWTRQLGSGADDVVEALATSRSGVHAAGWTDGALPGQSTEGSRDAFAARFHGDGTPVWTRQLGTGEADEADGLTTSSRGVYLAGMTEGTFAGSTSSGGSDAFLARLVSFRPDGWISKGGAYLGDNVYNTTGAGQTVSASFATRRTFFIRAQNDGDATDSISVAGCGSSEKFRVRYYRGNTDEDITASVVDGSFRFADVAPAEVRKLRMEIAVKPAASSGDTRDCTVTLTSQARSGIADVVKAKVTAEG